MQRDEGKRAAQPPPPGGWPAGSTSPSSPQGPETRSRKRTRTHSASSPPADSNGTLGAVVDAHRDIRRVTADSYQGHTTSNYRAWLQDINPQTAGKPAYTSYICAKVAQPFETGWGVGVVCCIAADPRLKSMTRILPALLMPCSRRGKPRHVSLNARRFQKGEWESLWNQTLKHNNRELAHRAKKLDGNAPSSPQGLETRSRKRARTDSASSPSAASNCTLGAVVDTHKDIRRVTADSYQGHTPSTYRDWLQGIDPQTAGKPAYT